MPDTISSESRSNWAPASIPKMLPYAELRIVLLYVFCAGLWIVYSDMALDWLTQDPFTSLRLQTWKGLNFVATTAGLLYLVLRRSFNRWRRAEQQIRETQERFEYVGRAATNAIWDWDLASGCVWWSDSFCKLFGYAREEVQPTTEAWHCRVHPDDKPATMAAIRVAFESGEPMWAGEYRFRRKDGSYAVVQDRGWVIRDAAGQAIRIVGGMTDITARKQAEEKVARSRQQLRALSARLQSLREAERIRIAREIHDELGQTLTGLKMNLRWAENHLAKESSPTLNPVLDKLVEAGELADATIASVQRIAAELRSGVLEDLGLVAALRHETVRFQERAGVACRLSVPESDLVLPREAATGVFRIFQEALTNVARHAEATEVEVQLARQAEYLVLQIADNGRGIRPADLEDAKSLGLLGMQERAETLGGQVTFGPGVPSGTVVRLKLPQPVQANASRASVL